MSFDTLGLPPALVHALTARSLDTALPVQEAALPVLMAGKSAMVISRTGSGKTLAYLLPILAAIDTSKPQVQAVILAPTHELAMQISRIAADLSKEAELGVRVQALIGGAAASRQIEGLKKKPHLVIGSAGRVTHLMGLGKLKLRDVVCLVLDEADRLLIEESLEHIRRITGELAAHARYVFVSATEGPATTRIAKGLAPALEVVRVQSDISPNIRHCYLVCEERDKFEWLRKALRGMDPKRTLVFVHRGSGAERVVERLDYHNLEAADLHGARDKFERKAALEAFRKGQARVLIASDIAARGLDIAEVELVVNVDVPSQSRDYLHRAGRTGRAGAQGLVLSLMSPNETRLAKRYAEDLGIAMERVELVRGALVHVPDAERGAARPPQKDRDAGTSPKTERPGKRMPPRPPKSAKRETEPRGKEDGKGERPRKEGEKPKPFRHADSGSGSGKKPGSEQRRNGSGAAGSRGGAPSRQRKPGGNTEQ